MLGGLALIAGALALVVPAFIDQVDELEERARQGLDEALLFLDRNFGLSQPEIDRAIEQAIERLRENGGATAPRAGRRATPPPRRRAPPPPLSAPPLCSLPARPARVR